LVRQHSAKQLATRVAPGEQPDKILFEKATNEINHGRYDVGRLTLQTLINTYPDSEYLSRAKLAIADSYYSEGGVSGLTQAEEEYKDFITFFPTAPEAPMAQFRVGMAHYRLMAKADRDQTEALAAEAEFKEFLLKYPDNPLISRVKARLREAQQVLAEGEYWTANFYFTHGAYLAARGRFQDLVEKYPNYSGGDNALYYLGQSLEHLRRPNDAPGYYARVITDFPLSPHVADAKTRLTALHQPIPHPTRASLARARADATHHQNKDFLAKMAGVMSSSPDTTATLHGPVHLGPLPTSGVEMAKKPGTGGPAPGTAAIVAQPVGESSLNSGQPIADPASAAAQPAESKPSPPSDASAPQSKETTPDKGQSNGNPETPSAKKKGRFHALKKVVKPF
jgi:outer membrane protein assembly factor BamD